MEHPSINRITKSEFNYNWEFVTFLLQQVAPVQQNSLTGFARQAVDLDE
jgi:hypothetical protein